MSFKYMRPYVIGSLYDYLESIWCMYHACNDDNCRYTESYSIILQQVLTPKTVPLVSTWHIEP